MAACVPAINELPGSAVKARVRISGGVLRGRFIRSEAVPGLRPSTERMREALFSALESRALLEGARVLDLFSGTGILAFESLSRGATSAVCVERDRRLVQLIRENAAELELQSAVRVLGCSVEAAIAKLEKAHFDLVLADPPYAVADPRELATRITKAQLTAADATLVFESPRPTRRADEPKDWDLFGYVVKEAWERNYGGTLLQFLRIEQQAK